VRRRGGALAAGVLWALAPSLVTAQSQKEVEQQFQFWGSLNSTTRLDDRWGAIADFHLRTDGFFEHPDFYFVRFGAHAWVRDDLTLSLGYAHMWKAPACDGCQEWTNEDRIYQQVQYVTSLGRTRIVHRFRNEQRWQQSSVNDVRTAERSFSDRVRYMASFTIPFSRNPALPSLMLSDEVALQFGPGVVFNTFDQNRLFAGIKQRLSSDWSFDFGYMLVYQQKASGYQYDLNHTLRLFFYFTPDRRKGRGEHEPGSGEE
jgi:hypothetical protein